MRLKTDENIGRRAVELLRAAGHDVMTVREQNLAGKPDQAIFHACCAERRTLITLDRDFGEPLRFPAEFSAGVVILELGGPASLRQIVNRIGEFMALAATRKVEGELRIVEPGRVRIRSKEDDEQG